MQINSFDKLTEAPQQMTKITTEDIQRGEFNTDIELGEQASSPIKILSLP